MRARKPVALLCAAALCMAVLAACTKTEEAPDGQSENLGIQAPAENQPAGEDTTGQAEGTPAPEDNPFVITGTLQSMDAEGNLTLLAAEGGTVLARLEADAEIAIEYVDEEGGFIEEKNATLAEALDAQSVSAVVMGGYEGELYMAARLILRVEQA